MSGRTRIALAAVVAALSLAVAVAPASAGKTGPNNVNAKKCQSYQDWVDANGNAFQSSAACAAYAAKGGQLVAKPFGLSISPESHFFLPDQGDSVEVTVTNTGGVANSAPLAVSERGDTLGEFTLQSDNCTGKTLAPGGTCTFTVHNGQSAACNTAGPTFYDVTVNGTVYASMDVGAEIVC